MQLSTTHHLRVRAPQTPEIQNVVVVVVRVHVDFKHKQVRALLFNIVPSLTSFKF